MEFNYIEKLEEHIKSLIKGYDKLIIILNSDLKTDKDKDDQVLLKDDKIKTFADGIVKASEGADTLLGMIKSKMEELEKLKNPKKAEEKKKKQEINDEYPLAKHLDNE